MLLLRDLFGCYTVQKTFCKGEAGSPALYSTVDELENIAATLIDIVTKDARQRGLNRSKLSRILILRFSLASPDGKVFSKKPKNYYILKSVSSVAKADIRVVYSYKNYYILKNLPCLVFQLSV